jgi:acyl-CoA synthetase (AMP-forming)/AMP-acid ligase II
MIQLKTCPGMPATESELKEYCRSTLSGFEVPERIHIVASFSHTAKGSTVRREHADRFSADASGRVAT